MRREQGLGQRGYLGQDRDLPVATHASLLQSKQKIPLRHWQLGGWLAPQRLAVGVHEPEEAHVRVVVGLRRGGGVGLEDDRGALHAAEDRAGLLHETKCWLAGEPNEYRSGHHSHAEGGREPKNLEKKDPPLCKRVPLGKAVEGPHNRGAGGAAPFPATRGPGSGPARSRRSSLPHRGHARARHPSR